MAGRGAGRQAWVRGMVGASVCWLLVAGCWLLPVAAITPLSFQADLAPTGGATFDAAGQAVAVSGDGATALVASANNNGARGRVTVFVRVGATWSQQVHLVANDASAGDGFGSRVALSANGTTALIGAPYKTSSSGAAYVFTRTGGTWAQTGLLTAPTIAAGEQFGAGVALAADGSVAAVGIPRRGVGSAAQAGAVQLFARSGGTYVTTGAALTLADAQEYDTLGTALALSADGGVLVAGVEARANNTGTAYAFTRGGGGAYTPQPLAPPAPAAYTSFGRSVAASNDGATLLVGEPGRTQGAQTNAGAAYAFTRGGGGAYTPQPLAAPDAVAFDAFGSAVAVSGDGTAAAISAPAQNSNVGAVYVANRVGAAFAIAQTITGTYTPGNPPYFGSSVALSALGSTAVIGAAGRATNTGGAYVFAAPSPAPTLTAIDPPAGPVGGGVPVGLIGTNFRPGMTITFDGVPAASVMYANTTRVVAVAPPHVSAQVAVSVTSAEGQTATLPNAYAYVNAAPAPLPTRQLPGNPAPAPPPHTVAATPPGQPTPLPAPTRR